MHSQANLLLLVTACGRGCIPEERPDRASPSETGDGDSDEESPTPPAGALVLDNVRVVDAAQVLEGAAVVVAQGAIWSVTDSDRDWPDDVSVEDWSGHTVLPGLIDAHVHLFHSGAPWWVGDALADNLAAQLAWGVTGVADVGSPEAVFDLRDRTADGTIQGPRIWATGPFLTAVGSHPCEVYDDESLCRYVDGDGAEQVAALDRADGIKVALADADFTGWGTPRLDTADLAAIVEAAEGRPVWAHVDEEGDATDALEAGVGVLAHPVFSADLDSVPDAPVHSTVSAFAGTEDLLSGDLLGDDLSRTREEVVDAWEWMAAHPDEFADGWIDGSTEWATHARHNLAVAVAEGRTVVAGSDAGYWFVPHGLALHRELEELVDAGMTPQEAIAAATAVPAALLGWEDAGFVQTGMRADLLIVEGDPSTDIRVTRSVAAVFRNGERIEPGAEPWRAVGEGAFCLDDRDCPDAACDLVDHACTQSCAPAWDPVGSCDADTWCMPADGLATTSEAVCHPGETCDLYAQDCGQPYYGENCVPADLDTNSCWPSGPQEPGSACSWIDPDLYCVQGAYCSSYTYFCYEMCEPGAPGACRGCTMQYAEGEPWFGLCL